MGTGCSVGVSTLRHETRVGLLGSPLGLAPQLCRTHRFMNPLWLNPGVEVETAPSEARQATHGGGGEGSMER